MNTLYIKNGEIQLIGFETIHDKIFFSFRNGGLVISSEKQEIEPQQIEEIVPVSHSRLLETNLHFILRNIIVLMYLINLIDQLIFRQQLDVLVVAFFYMKKEDALFFKNIFLLKASDFLRFCCC